MGFTLSPNSVERRKMRNKDEVIKEWWISYEYGDSERFLDFAEGLNINEFVKEDGERVVWLEDGNHGGGR